MRNRYEENMMKLKFSIKIYQNVENHHKNDEVFLFPDQSGKKKMFQS